MYQKSFGKESNDVNEFLHQITFQTPTPKGRRLKCDLVTVTFQPINHLLYINNSAKGRIIIYNRRLKGEKV